MIADREDNARLQSDFYRDQYRRILNLLLASLVVIYILLAAIAYVILFEPEQPYYANTSDGKILPMPHVER